MLLGLELVGFPSESTLIRAQKIAPHLSPNWPFISSSTGIRERNGNIQATSISNLLIRRKRSSLILLGKYTATHLLGPNYQTVFYTRWEQLIVS